MTRHRSCLKAPDHSDDAGPPGATGPEAAQQEPGAQEDSRGEAAAPAGPALASGLLDACGRERRLVTRTRERYAEVRQRTGAGESLGAISRAMGLDRATVRRFARAGSVDELLVKATSRESKLDEFKPYLHHSCFRVSRDGMVCVIFDERGQAG